MSGLLAVNTLQATRLRRITFVLEVLLRADGNEVQTIIAKCDDFTVYAG